MIPFEHFQSIVEDALKTVMKTDKLEIAADDSFSDLGLDSLDSMSLLLELEKQLSIEFDEEFDLLEYNDTNKLHQYISTQ